jgi:hypothetical protein
VTSRADLKRAWKERKVPMGVLVIRHRASGRFLLHASLDLPARLNRLQVEVTPSTNPNRALLADWLADGREGFEIRALDELAPRDEPGWDAGEELEALRALWQERLAAEGGTPY